MTPSKFNNASGSPDTKMKSLMQMSEKDRMDSQKEIELSASPVKKGRREYTQQHQVNDDSFDNKFEEESEKVRKTNKKAHEIEERGSRSPDKKRRKAAQNNNDSPLSNGMGAFQLQKLSGFEDNQVKKLNFEELRRPTTNEDSSSVSYKPEDQPIIV